MKSKNFCVFLIYFVERSSVKLNSTCWKNNLQIFADKTQSSIVTRSIWKVIFFEVFFSLMSHNQKAFKILIAFSSSY